MATPAKKPPPGATHVDAVPKDAYVALVHAGPAPAILAATPEEPWCWKHVDNERLHVEGTTFFLGVEGEPWVYPFEVVRVMCDLPFDFPFTYPETRGGVPVQRRRVYIARVTAPPAPGRQAAR